MKMKASANELQKLKNIIETLADVPEEEWAYFSGNLTAQCFHKNQLLIHAGEPVTDFWRGHSLVYGI